MAAFPLALWVLAATCTAPSGVGFADSLMARGDYYRAIGEYERELYLVPDGPQAAVAELAIGRAYLRGGEAAAAVLHFDSLAARKPELGPRASLESAYALYLANDTRGGDALRSWVEHNGPSAPVAWQQRASYLLAWAEMTQAHGPQAAMALDETGDFVGRPTLRSAALNLAHLPHKSPWVAGLWSIFPGAGYLYVGQPAIAAAAFAWNGLFAFAAGDALHHGMVGLGLVLCLFESLWYFGSIAGAVSAAFKYDRDARRNALDRLRSEFDDRPESWPPAPPVLPSPQ